MRSDDRQNLLDQENDMGLHIGKTVMAISRATYRGYSILEVRTGFYSVALGMKWFSSNSLKAVTNEIDKWIDLKKN